jgi:hypothetical protein
MAFLPFPSVSLAWPGLALPALALGPCLSVCTLGCLLAGWLVQRRRGAAETASKAGVSCPRDSWQRGGTVVDGAPLYCAWYVGRGEG